MKDWKRPERAERPMPPTLKVKYLREGAKAPYRGSKGSAGLDLCSTDDVMLFPGDIRQIRTGVAMEIPVGYWGHLVTRSSFGKIGVRLSSGSSVIDSDYRGEVMIYMRNDGDYPCEIRKGDRVAQIVLVPYLSVQVAVVEELSKTERETGGFGSTGRA